MRCFIAIELPDSVKSVLADFQHELKKSAADIRWVRPEGMHLTLKFLGDIDENLTRSVSAVLEGTCRNHLPFSITISDVGVFPGFMAPRVLWVGVHNNKDIEVLYNDLSEGLSAIGFRKEKRKFIPHLTLGRFRSSKGKSELMRRVDAFRYRKFGQVDVMAVSLMKSELKPGGAEYSRISDASLGHA